MTKHTRLHLLVAPVASASLVLAACGGSEATNFNIGNDRSVAAATPAPAPAAAPATATAVAPVSSRAPAPKPSPASASATRPLRAADIGSAAQAEPVLHEAFAEPTDPAARTRAALYLSARGAQELERRLGGDVVWTHVPCCSAEHRDTAILIAYGMQALQNLDNDAPVLIRGQNPRETAAVADRLTAAGMRRVIVVSW